jgi:hypothetical protein
MRKPIIIGVVALGAAAGLLSAYDDGWATGVVMALVGVLFVAPIAAALTRRSKPNGEHPARDDLPEPGSVASPKALVANYWRDKGHAPFTKPSEADPDEHMFDPEKLG